jgi:hypothetical protein
VVVDGDGDGVEDIEVFEDDEVSLNGSTTSYILFPCSIFTNLDDGTKSISPLLKFFCLFGYTNAFGRRVKDYGGLENIHRYEEKLVAIDKTMPLLENQSSQRNGS